MPTWSTSTSVTPISCEDITRCNEQSIRMQLGIPTSSNYLTSLGKVLDKLRDGIVAFYTKYRTIAEKDSDDISIISSPSRALDRIDGYLKDTQKIMDKVELNRLQYNMLWDTIFKWHGILPDMFETVRIPTLKTLDVRRITNSPRGNAEYITILTMMESNFSDMNGIVDITFANIQKEANHRMQTLQSVANQFQMYSSPPGQTGWNYLWKTQNDITKKIAETFNIVFNFTSRHAANVLDMITGWTHLLETYEIALGEKSLSYNKYVAKKDEISDIVQQQTLTYDMIEKRLGALENVTMKFIQKRNEFDNAIIGSVESTTKAQGEFLLGLYAYINRNTRHTSDLKFVHLNDRCREVVNEISIHIKRNFEQLDKQRETFMHAMLDRMRMVDGTDSFTTTTFTPKNVTDFTSASDYLDATHHYIQLLQRFVEQWLTKQQRFEAITERAIAREFAPKPPAAAAATTTGMESSATRAVISALDAIPPGSVVTSSGRPPGGGGVMRALTALQKLSKFSDR